MLNTTQQVSDVHQSPFTPETWDRMMELINNTDLLVPSVGEFPGDEWDAQTQAVLDQYWPGTTELSAIKRIENKAIYTAMYNDEEIIVKSIAYTDEYYDSTRDQMTFLNFIGRDLNVATYVEPGVEYSDDKKLLVTMSRFVYGESPKEVGDQAPYTWIFDENAVKTIGKFWHDYRRLSIEFKGAHAETYEHFPDYKTFQNGWERAFHDITIPVTDTSYGVIHGDAHTGNFMLQDLGNDQWAMGALDFDNAERAWYVIDIGTEVWGANMQMYNAKFDDSEREARISDMKKWIFESYGWDLTEDELYQGCRWRRDFIYFLSQTIILLTPRSDPGW